MITKAPILLLLGWVFCAVQAQPTITGDVVTFKYMDKSAASVSVAGDFNGWSKDEGLMLHDGSARWSFSKKLSPGIYQYKFLVDGQWLPDLLARENVYNEHGTLNSVVEVRA